MIERSYRIAGLDCAEEESLLRRALGNWDGVEHLRFDVVRAKMIVRLDPEKVPEEALRARVAATGLRAEAWEDRRGVSRSSGVDRARVISTVTAGVLLSVGGTLELSGVPMPWPAVFFGASMLTCGWWVARKAWGALCSLALDMNFLMLVAAVGAAGIGEWFEGAAALFLFAVAGWLEAWSTARARRAIEALLDLTPPTARRRLCCGGEVDTPLEDVSVGSRIVIRSGDRVPLDGRIVEGAGDVNEAPITGESVPVDKAVGDRVYAGTINGAGLLVVETTHTARDTTLARIIHMVEEAQARRAPAQQWVDRFAAIYTPLVCGLAVAAAVAPPLWLGQSWSEWVYRSLTLLVIACPCALVISTPVALVCGLTRAARDGILVKGGSHLENLGRADCVAFDKTGTLTVGRAHVCCVVPLNDHTEQEVLATAAALETRSAHPLAQAIVREAERRGVPVEPASDVVTLTGRGAEGVVGPRRRKYWIGSHRLLEERGVETEPIHDRAMTLETQGHTVVVVGTEHHACGMLGLGDRLRESARPALGILRALGFRHMAMLTGDNEGTARAVAAHLPIDEVCAELLPRDKADAVRRFQSRGLRVLMVGDGVNDAPALATADTSVAMGAAASDAALETADVAVLGDDLACLPVAVMLSRRTLRTIRVNVAASLVTKAVFLVLAVLGWATLWAAVAADMGTSLVVVFNSLRLLEARGAVPSPDLAPAVGAGYDGPTCGG